MLNSGSVYLDLQGLTRLISHPFRKKIIAFLTEVKAYDLLHATVIVGRLSTINYPLLNDIVQ